MYLLFLTLIVLELLLLILILNQAPKRIGKKNVTSFLVKAYIMWEWRLSIAHIFAIVDATLEDKKIEFSHLNYFIENHDYTNLFVFKEHKWGKGLFLSLKRDLFHFLQHIPVTNSQKMEINK